MIVYYKIQNQTLAVDSDNDKKPRDHNGYIHCIWCTPNLDTPVDFTIKEFNEIYEV